MAAGAVLFALVCPVYLVCVLIDELAQLPLESLLPLYNGMWYVGCTGCCFYSGGVALYPCMSVGVCSATQYMVEPSCRVGTMLFYTTVGAACDIQ